jgi:hypothetical protein
MHGINACIIEMFTASFIMVQYVEFNDSMLHSKQLVVNPLATDTASNRPYTCDMRAASCFIPTPV